MCCKVINNSNVSVIKCHLTSLCLKKLFINDSVSYILSSINFEEHRRKNMTQYELSLWKSNRIMPMCPWDRIPVKLCQELHQRWVFFSKICSPHYSMTLMYVNLISIPLHNFVRSTYWYYRLHKIRNKDFKLDPSGVRSIPSFMQSHRAVLVMNHDLNEWWLIS